CFVSDVFHGVPEREECEQNNASIAGWRTGETSSYNLPRTVSCRGSLPARTVFYTLVRASHSG
ncbi:MAG: hypothetical protein WAU35_03625, partial [Azonexus sp.]